MNNEPTYERTATFYGTVLSADLEAPTVQVRCDDGVVRVFRVSRMMAADFGAVIHADVRLDAVERVSAETGEVLGATCHAFFVQPVVRLEEELSRLQPSEWPLRWSEVGPC